MKLPIRKFIHNQQIKNNIGSLRTMIALFGIILLFTLVHWAILISMNPILTQLPYWFFYMHKQTVHKEWIGLAILILGVSMIIGFSRTKTLLKLCLLVLCGAGIQLSLGFSQGKGFEGIRQNLVNTGHFEFVTLAVQERSMLDVAMNYESKVQTGELSGFAVSKPPGTLLFYMISERLANFNINSFDFNEHVENMVSFSSLIWPIISYLVLIPLWMLGKTIIGKEGAMTACLLYLSIPSVNLITLHLDQVIFPFLAVLPVALITLAYSQQKIWLAILSGIAYYMAVYFSFGLVFVIIIILMMFIVFLIKSASENKLLILQLFGITLISIAVSDILTRILLDYDIVARYGTAVTNHVNTRGWDFDIRTYTSASITNIIEFSVWIGIPITILFLNSIFFSTIQVVSEKKINLYSGLTLVIVLIFILLLIFGQTKGETARLWMFLIPFICVLTANFIHSKMVIHKNWGFVIIGLILTLEFVTTYLTLWHQNFR